MSKFKNYILFIAVLLAAGILIGSTASAWNKPKTNAVPVSIKLTEIARNPHALKGKAVTFSARFAARGILFKEKDAIFTPENYENFSIWESEPKFWVASELKRIYPTLYITKEDKKLSDRLRVLKQFDKIEVTGVVESLYANMPWIRVTDLHVIKDDDLDPAMVGQISKAIEYIDSKEYQKAKICFEIAKERRLPLYVEDLIATELAEIKHLKAEEIKAKKRELACDLLTKARNYAEASAFEKAATTYGKALKINAEYNSSPAIHKEIAGFFIDFYNARKEPALLEYSINEFNIAQKIIAEPDSDILYALAYIETLKAKVSNDYRHAEELARECLKQNPHHYNARKLLADIISQQLTASRNNTEDTDIILPVAPKKRIKLPVIAQKSDNIRARLDELIDEQELLSLEDDMENLNRQLKLNSPTQPKSYSQVDVKDNETEIPGINADDFDEILSDIESDLTTVPQNTDEIALPDFPVSFSRSKLPELAL